VTIPPDGTTALDSKFVTIRLITGTLTGQARRLDGVAAPTKVSVPEGYGPVSLQAFGVLFPTPGCWEVIQQLMGHELRFVIRVVSN
jgi:hypothetical protein